MLFPIPLLTALAGRIHFCVKYPDLDYQSRREVWKTFLSKITGEVGNIPDQELDGLAKYSLNGRQVRESGYSNNYAR